MEFREKALIIDCLGEALPAVFHPGAVDATEGVVIVVGGPQYRIGSHRQFVRIARRLANVGVPVLRFDYRGMGDASGRDTRFDETSSDIGAAIQLFFETLPGLENVSLFGLCDAASACMIYAPSDERVSRLILMNPWVRGAGSAKSAVSRKVRHYYLPRLFSRDFWRRLRRKQVSITSVFDDLGQLTKSVAHDSQAENYPQFVREMCVGLTRFSGAVLFVLSALDLTAREF
ncbi:MAG: hydrolase 1, exosortase A system-associated, partial [Pseudomonadota bacterium]